MEERSKCFMHVALREISMLNNSPWHPKISTECCVTHTFEGLAGAVTWLCVCVCVCARQPWTKERDIYWQVHLAVKAPLFNSQTAPPCAQSTTASPLLVHPRAEMLKVCPWQFDEVLSLQSESECCVNARWPPASSCSTRIFFFFTRSAW